MVAWISLSIPMKAMALLTTGLGATAGGAVVATWAWGGFGGWAGPGVVPGAECNT